MNLTRLVAGILMALLDCLSAQASPVDVSYTVSGAAGNWLLDFSFANNMPGSNWVYFVGVELPSANIVASPTGWPPYPGGWYIPSDTYNDAWCFQGCMGSTTSTSPGIAFGQSLSGFELKDTELMPPSSVKWSAFSEFITLVNGSWQQSGSYSGPGCYSITCGTWNPALIGAATPVAAVPEPSTWAMLLIGFAGIGFITYRRSRNAPLRKTRCAERDRITSPSQHRSRNNRARRAGWRRIPKLFFRSQS
jgi:PEP-CTERM motif